MDDVALVLGGSHGDVPLVAALRAAGVGHVVVLGGDPRGPAHAAADQSIIADYSDTRAVINAVRSLNVRVVVPGSNDFAAVAASEAAAVVGLDAGDTPEVTRRFHLKDDFRRAAAPLGVPVPRQFSEADPPDAGDFPVIVKPVDLTGGKGVAIARGPDELKGLARESRSRSRSRSLVIESLIEGRHHGVSAVVADGRVVFAFFDDEYYRPGRFEVAAASAPTSLGPLLQSEVVDAIGRMAEVWSLADGIVHMQLVARGGEWFVIDTCRRIPGDLYVDLVREATGVDYVAGLVELWLGRPWVPGPVAGRRVMRICLEAPADGIFRGVRPPPATIAVTEIVERGVVVHRGDKVGIALVTSEVEWRGLQEVESQFAIELEEPPHSS